MAKGYDVLDHEMVPDHEIIDEGEKERLLDRLNITEEQLPRIKSNDEAVKAIDAEEGDVIKITRDSPTAGETTYYRLVVSD